MTDTDMLVLADAELGGAGVFHVGELVRALRDALAAALERIDTMDGYRIAAEMAREAGHQAIAERDAALTRAELAECHAEALEDALNEPLWRFDNPIAPVALVGAALLLGWLLWGLVT